MNSRMKRLLRRRRMSETFSLVKRWNPPTDARKKEAIRWLREQRQIVIDPVRIPFALRDFSPHDYGVCGIDLSSSPSETVVVVVHPSGMKGRLVPPPPVTWHLDRDEGAAEPFALDVVPRRRVDVFPASADLSIPYHPVLRLEGIAV